MTYRPSLRTVLTGAVLVLAALAFVVPAQATQCPLFPDWCSCNYCYKYTDCNCRLHEGSPSGTTCEYYLFAGGCGSLQGSADMAELPEATGGEQPLEQILSPEENTAATLDFEACR